MLATKLEKTFLFTIIIFTTTYLDKKENYNEIKINSELFHLTIFLVLPYWQNSTNGSNCQ